MKLFNTKHPFIVWSILIMAIGAGIWIYFAFYREAAPDSESREDLVKFVASDKFRTLSFEKRKYYVDKIRQQNQSGNAGRRHFSREEMQKLPEAERRKAMENLFRTEMIVRDHEALEFLKMNEDEKIVFLDRRIDEMEEFHRQHEARRAEAKKNPNARPENAPKRLSQEERAARLKQHLEHTPPEVRAARTELFRAMHARMKARGKSFPRPPKR